MKSPPAAQDMAEWCHAGGWSVSIPEGDVMPGPDLRDPSLVRAVLTD